VADRLHPARQLGEGDVDPAEEEDRHRDQVCAEEAVPQAKGDSALERAWRCEKRYEQGQAGDRQ
jgi:hypothetical protein